VSSDNQKPDDFQIEDWAIPEDELPWNTPVAAQASKTTHSNVVELDQYRRERRNSPPD
jgi:hypothetical protein